MEQFQEMTDEQLRFIFAASCIEAAAHRQGVTVRKMYGRMRRVDMIRKYILRCYDVLHTMSRTSVTDDILNTLVIMEEHQGIGDVQKGGDA